MKILYTRSDGGVSIITPSPKWTGTMEELAAKDVPDGLQYEIVEDNSIPIDRTFRNAWIKNGKIIKVDMPKARDVWRNKIRKERELKFAKLDVEFDKAIERDDRVKKAEVAAKKQALRDLPAHPSIEAAQTPEELKVIWFEE